MCFKRSNRNYSVSRFSVCESCKSKSWGYSVGINNVRWSFDERARELNFEGMRRQDLIRFGKFTGGTYLWPWKGGVKNGTSISDNYKVFPIPSNCFTV
jgi:hypothetical protein